MIRCLRAKQLLDNGLHSATYRSQKSVMLLIYGVLCTRSLSLAVETAEAICLYTVLNDSVEKLARERSGRVGFESSETQCEGKGSRYITCLIQYMVVKVQAESRPIDHFQTRVGCLKFTNTHPKHPTRHQDLCIQISLSRTVPETRLQIARNNWSHEI